ncbi:hypothetical protein N0V93_006973 [Gnomoniopsis smithogilvyi]|uniref:NAD(P)-binding protein n=1 Tax=Gnomoniopsis smithogilvyi TaxID=1191159 RepID=A0A9W8YSQ4_9PEZI|nr:hypothetical protein N0V93_006973 [Gnomoniopsis smithogilvyi]
MSVRTAYLTGGAHGIGLAVTERLVARGIKVAIADLDLDRAKEVAATLNAQQNADLVSSYQVDVSNWESQRQAFTKAVEDLGRIDLVFPIAGIGENRSWLPKDPHSTEFTKPDLTIIDVNLTGFLYTSSIAIQQMRKQAVDEYGFRGKILAAASICGFYCASTIPVYTASKHGVVGFVRSYGKHLPEEGIALNAVCPNVVRTGINDTSFYNILDQRGLLTDIRDVVNAFESFVDNNMSGECAEVGPNGGFTIKSPTEYLDRESEEVVKYIAEGHRHLHSSTK